MPEVIERQLSIVSSPIVRFGLGYGGVAAMILSYSANKSILWMLIDGWLNWIYVLYYALFY